MNYQEFKDYVVPYLWKKGDQQLIDNLDTLIRQGEAKLNRDVRTEFRHTSVNLSVIEQRLQLPLDYDSMRQVVDLDGKLGEFQYVTPAELETERTRKPSLWQPIYSLERNYIMFAGPTTGGRKTSGPTPPASPQEGDLWSRTSDPAGLYKWVVDPTSSQWVQLTAETAVDEEAATARNVVVHYNRKIRDFQVDDASWFEEEEPDLFLHAVLIQTAPFLREDERIPVWTSYYNENMGLLNEQSAHDKQRGVYKDMPLPRRAGGYKPRNSRGRSAFKLQTRS